MDFLDAVVTIGGSVLSGGVTGLLGTGLSFIADHFKRKQDLEAKRLDHQHELALRADDRKTIKAEYEGQSQVARIEGEAAESAADAAAFSESFNMDPKRYSDPKKVGPFFQGLFAWLDFWRGSIRPGLTTYLVVLVTLIYWQLQDLMLQHKGTIIPLTKVEELVVLIISTVLYLMTTTVLWWFGTRNKQKPPKSA